MTPVQRVDALLRGLVGAVERELTVLEEITVRIQHAAGRSSVASDDGPARAYLAVEIHKYYTALESILERIFKVLDGAVPRGDRSHQEMLVQAALPVEGIRPAVVDAEIAGDLSHLLSFRHFFRHAYAVGLDWDKLEEHRARVERLHPKIIAGVGGCLAHVRATLSSIPEE